MANEKGFKKIVLKTNDGSSSSIYNDFRLWHMA
jgi:hypothetical protein